MSGFKKKSEASAKFDAQETKSEIEIDKFKEESQTFLNDIEIDQPAETDENKNSESVNTSQEESKHYQGKGCNWKKLKTAEMLDFKKNRKKIDNSQKMDPEVKKHLKKESKETISSNSLKLNQQLEKLCNLKYNAGTRREFSDFFKKMNFYTATNKTFRLISKIFKTIIQGDCDFSFNFIHDIHSVNLIYDEQIFINLDNQIDTEYIARQNFDQAVVISKRKDTINFVDVLLTYYETAVKLIPKSIENINLNKLHKIVKKIDDLIIDEKRIGFSRHEEQILFEIANNFSNRISELLNHIEAAKEKMKEGNDSSFSVQISDKSKDLSPEELDVDPELGPPPDDFKKKNIFLTYNDLICPKPYLRKLRMHTPYLNINDYFDTHFRLLYEDFYSQVKKGINEHIIRKQKNEIEENLDGLQIYRGELEEKMASHFSIDFMIRIDVGPKFFLSNKRFIPGTLLILTKNDFKTFYICIVRKIFENNKKENGTMRGGYLYLMVEPKLGNKNEKDGEDQGDINEVFYAMKSRKILIAETCNYFEGYYHCLTRMQTLENFPFSSIIVEGVKKVETPSYLNELAVNSEGLIYEKLKDDVTHTINAVIKNTQLDPSQVAAIEEAFKREICIIQGPPGTGKTYVSVIIVQILLRLKVHSAGPIFVICYTNHALDQFLTLIEKHTKSIIRIGGRCKNPEIEKYTLKVMRQNGLIPQTKQGRYYIAKKSQFQKLYNIKADYLTMLRKCQFMIDFTEMPQKFQLLSEFYEKGIDDILINKGASGEDFVNYLDGRLRGLSLQAKAFLLWLGIINISYLEKEWDGISDSRATVHRSGFNQESIANSNLGQSKMLQTHFLDQVSQNDLELTNLRNAENALYQVFADQQEEDESRYSFIEEEKTYNDFLRSPPVSYAPDCKTNMELILKTREAMCQKIPQNDDILTEMVYDEYDSFGLGVDGKNFYNINMVDRWAINNHLVEKTCRMLERQIQEFGKNFDDFKNLAQREQEYALSTVLKGAQIVGVTITGAAKYSSLLCQMKSNVTIIEEAAEVIECQVITSLTPSLKHLILVGDHKQLRPIVNDARISQDYRLEISLFERLVNQGYPKVQLLCQRRMRPELSDIVRLFYPNLENSLAGTNRPDIRNMATNVYFFTHTWPEERPPFAAQSFANFQEADFIIRFATYLLQNGYESSDIAILSLYSGQLLYLQFEALKRPFMGNIRVCTVDEFQGEESTIVLLSLVRSNKNGNIGFLQFDNRINVAFSRARDGLYAFGNMNVIRDFYEKKKHTKPNLLLHKIIVLMNNNSTLGSELPLRCVRHGKNTVVRNLTDFDQSPEGGCDMSCDMVKECGHVCTRFCHFYEITDDDLTGHKYEKCCLPCIRNHGCEHKCSNMCRECLPEDYKCQEKVKIFNSNCMHNFEVPCYDRDNPENQNCQSICFKKLPCGHPCYRKCFENCLQINIDQASKQFRTSCTHNIDIILECGHKNQKPCGQEEAYYRKMKQCSDRCDQKLICGHDCSGRCRNCRVVNNEIVDFLHVGCNQSCGKVLPCGHYCKDTCSPEFGCSPCVQCCNVKFIDGNCNGCCGNECVGYTKQCSNQCLHRKCDDVSWEICSVPPCQNPCMKTLRCGHPCIGFCGEICPDLCRICNPKDIAFKPFLKCQITEKSRWVKLDCNHVIVSTILDKIFGDRFRADPLLSYPVCPLCNSPVYKTNRYQAQSKGVTHKVNAIKRAIEKSIIDMQSHIESSEFYAQFGNSVSKEPVVSNLLNESLSSVKKMNLSLVEMNIAIGKLNIFQFLKEIWARFPTSEKKAFFDSITAKLSIFLMKPEINEWVLNSARTQIEALRLYAQLYVLKIKLSKKLELANDRNIESFSELIATFMDEMENFEGPFGESYLKMVENSIQESFEIVPEAKLAFPENLREKTYIPSLGSGRYVVCPKYHVFTIKENGVLVGELRCQNCGRNGCKIAKQFYPEVSLLSKSFNKTFIDQSSNSINVSQTSAKFKVGDWEKLLEQIDNQEDKSELNF